MHKQQKARGGTRRSAATGYLRSVGAAAGVAFWGASNIYGLGGDPSPSWLMDDRNVSFGSGDEKTAAAATVIINSSHICNVWNQSLTNVTVQEPVEIAWQDTNSSSKHSVTLSEDLLEDVLDALQGLDFKPSVLEPPWVRAISCWLEMCVLCS